MEYKTDKQRKEAESLEKERNLSRAAKLVKDKKTLSEEIKRINNKKIVEDFNPNDDFTDINTQKEYEDYLEYQKSLLVSLSNCSVFIHSNFNGNIRMSKDELIAVTAESGQGKSLTLVNIAVKLLEDGKKVLYFTNEMDKNEIRTWIACLLEGVSHKAIRTRTIDNIKLKKVNDRVKDITTSKKLIVKGSEDKDIPDRAELILKYIQDLNTDNIPDCIILDYLSNIESIESVSSSTSENFQVLESFMKSLKVVAKQYCPIVIATQLHPSGPGRSKVQNRMYMGSSLYQKATTVVEVVANTETKTTRFNIVKARNGTAGTVEMKYKLGRYIADTSTPEVDDDEV